METNTEFFLRSSTLLQDLYTVGQNIKIELPEYVSVVSEPVEYHKFFARMYLYALITDESILKGDEANKERTRELLRRIMATLDSPLLRLAMKIDAKKSINT